MSGASTNWAGNLTYSAASIHHPTSVAEVQQLVAQHSRVKALGTRHSFNTIADSSGGALISLSELPPEIEVDTGPIAGPLLEACSCLAVCPCWVGEDPDGGAAMP